MQVLERLNGKKGLIATALMISVMLGAYAGGFYTWRVYYDINPLTDFEEITIPTTTGATIGTWCWLGEEERISIHVDKPLYLIFAVSFDDIGAVVEDYYFLIFSVHLFDSESNPVEFEYVYDGIDYLGAGMLPLVLCGDPAYSKLGSPYYDEESEKWVIPNPGYVDYNGGFVYLYVYLDPQEQDYYGFKDVFYWTGAIGQEGVSGSFTVYVFAVEDEALDTFFEHFGG